MSKKFLVFTMCVSVLLLPGCIGLMSGVSGNGDVVTQSRKISKFNKLDISGGYELILTQGDEPALIIEADSNLQEYIKVEVKHKTLYISTTKSINSSESLKLYLTFSKLEAIDVSGAIEISQIGSLRSKRLSIDVSGASDIDLDIETKTLTLSLSGSSKTTLNGKATNVKADISGAGKINATKMEVERFELDISGAGSAKINVSEYLDVSISGAGSVKYTGNPEVTKSISGAGSIKQI